jgi:L-lactate dehydrogenase complex protein LldF
MHLVLVDNGRSALLAQPSFRRSLNCIRCGACMNTCPVYRRSGGHSYRSTIPGPIGSILTPARDPAGHASLPYASSLCGSCTDVCPVKIDLHTQLLAWRSVIAHRRLLPASKRLAMQAASFVFQRPWLYAALGGLVRRLIPCLPRRWVYNRFNPWGRQRELPPMPKKSFRRLYQERHGQ